MKLGYTLHCVFTAPNQPPNRPFTDVAFPNNFQATWQVDEDIDGDRERTDRFHLLKLTFSKCEPDANGGFAIEFTGLGRYNGRPCNPANPEGDPATNLDDCGFIKGRLKDGGEPGSQPGPDFTWMLDIYEADANGPGVLHGCECPIPEGNYQFHPVQVS